MSFPHIQSASDLKRGDFDNKVRRTTYVKPGMNPIELRKINLIQ